MKVQTMVGLIVAHYTGQEAKFRELALEARNGVSSPEFRRLIGEAIRHGDERPAQAGPGQRKKSSSDRPPFCVPLEPCDINALVLSEAVRHEVDAIVAELRHREKFEARNIRPRTRILLWGEPGNGKTCIARAVATSLGLSANGVDLSSVVDSHPGETANRLGQILGAADVGSVLVLDEIDAIASKRSDYDSACGKEQAAIVSALLTLFDRSFDGIVIATTNMPDELDPALRRRFDMEMEIGGPDENSARRLAEMLCAQWGLLLHVPRQKSYALIERELLNRARRVVLAEIEREEANGQEKEAV